jgi:hypothetical protein
LGWVVITVIRWIEFSFVMKCLVYFNFQFMKFLYIMFLIRAMTNIVFLWEGGITSLSLACCGFGFPTWLMILHGVFLNFLHFFEDLIIFLCHLPKKTLHIDLTFQYIIPKQPQRFLHQAVMIFLWPSSKHVGIWFKMMS